jgi:glycosyltransferase involved in cell wall biosynthesis
VCWDERAGIPSIVRGGLPVATGVVALTDRDRGHLSRYGRVLRRAHRVWALSTAQLPVLRDEVGVPADRLRHLLFGIDADYFTMDGAEPTPGLVSSAGNDQHRDHPTVVAAMAEVRRRVPHARLELATHHEIDVPAEVGIRHPRLTGPLMRELYQRSQVVVVALRPNLHVSGVTVALEAMASGRPVIVTDTPGMADYVADGQWGLLVPPGDVDALAAAIVRLLSDPDEATGLGMAGHKAVHERFTTDGQARRLAELLRD